MNVEYKRLEIYTGWKCNHKCVFCIEFPNMEEAWDKEVSRFEMTKKLIKFRKLWYNHVTFLGWEPFIHPVFWFATRFAKKLWYTVLVTTNASTIQFDTQAKKHLPNVDQLLISVPSIHPEKQLEVNRTKWVIHFEKVFDNIEKYWKGNLLKINTVINQLNLSEIEDIIDFLWKRSVDEISLTYPDITMPYYSKEHIIEYVAPKYSDVKRYIPIWFKKAEEYGISLKIVDIPFCCLPWKEYIPYTDDYVYQTRTKINHKEEKIERVDFLPRRRLKVPACRDCSMKDICWGPSRHYEELYWLEEIQALSYSIESEKWKKFIMWTQKFQ